MKEITLTQEELNELLSAMQEQIEITSETNYQLIQVSKDDYIYNFSTKDGNFVAFNIFAKYKELVAFNIVNKDGELLFDEDVIFIFILSDVIKAGTKNGEVIEIDNIISK